MNWFYELHPIWQALIATLGTWAVTAAGAGVGPASPAAGALAFPASSTAGAVVVPASTAAGALVGPAVAAIEPGGAGFRRGFGGFLIATLASVICFYVSRRISQPIEKLKKDAENFAKGNLAHRLPVPSTQETAGLAEAMNVMAELRRKSDFGFADVVSE